jgi:hypothetical protein
MKESLFTCPKCNKRFKTTQCRVYCSCGGARMIRVREEEQ